MCCVGGCVLKSGNCGGGCELTSTWCKYDLLKVDIIVLSWVRVRRVRRGISLQSF